MTPQRDNRVKVSALLRAEPRVCEVANLVGVSRTIVYAIKKRIDDSEGANRHAGCGRKTVVDHDSLRDIIRETASKGIMLHIFYINFSAFSRANSSATITLCIGFILHLNDNYSLEL